MSSSSYTLLPSPSSSASSASSFYNKLPSNLFSAGSIVQKLISTSKQLRYQGKRLALKPSWSPWWYHTYSKPKSSLQYYDFHEIPKHLQDNQYILHKYRAFYTASQCYHSIFTFHNETLNIWTHLFATVFFFSHLLNCYFSSPQPCYYDTFILSFYLMTAMGCFFCSTLFHTWHCHHQVHVFDTMCIMDYTGIGVLLLGSSTSLVYFTRPPHLFWHLLCSAVPCCLAMGVPWVQTLRHHRLRKLRTLILLVLAFVCVIVLTVTFYQVYHVHGIGSSWMPWAMASLGSYSIGTFIYVFQLPERWYPGKFDLFGSSHQIWHVLAMSGVYFHFRILMELQTANAILGCLV